MTKVTWATALLVLGAATADGQLAGDWRGFWARGGDTLAVMLHVRTGAGSNQLTATFDSDRLRVMGIPFTEMTFTGSTVLMRLQGDRTTTVFTGAVRADTLSGSFEEAATHGAFSYTRVASVSAAPTEREVSFRNGDVTLAGSLIVPATSGRHPAVIFVHGSGAEGRFASRFWQ